MDQLIRGAERRFMMEGIVERRSLETGFLKLGPLSQVKNAVKRVFGCWHSKLSLPFTRGDETYRTCINCGARRRFDLDQWVSVGGFLPPDEISRKE